MIESYNPDTVFGLSEYKVNSWKKNISLLKKHITFYDINYLQI